MNELHWNTIVLSVTRFPRMSFEILNSRSPTTPSKALSELVTAVYPAATPAAARPPRRPHPQTPQRWNEYPKKKDIRNTYPFAKLWLVANKSMVGSLLWPISDWYQCTAHISTSKKSLNAQYAIVKKSVLLWLSSQKSTPSDLCLCVSKAPKAFYIT